MPAPDHIGASFSLHRCTELDLDPQQTLQAAIDDLGLRRFRLMSYWDIHEPTSGQYNFDELDWQMNLIAQYNGQVSLCLGVRQPRWPEFHMPVWAQNSTPEQWHGALLDFIRTVVGRYKNHPALHSWQLENEALLRSFGQGTNIDYSRKRLRTECRLVKSLDPNHPVIMTLSDSWGIPVFGPTPDQFACSLYRMVMTPQGKLRHDIRPPLFYTLRGAVVQLLTWRPVYIHELQMEPWFNTGITQVSVDTQIDQFGPTQVNQHLTYANRTRLHPIDMWGLEWWYWLKTTQNRPELWTSVQSNLQ